MLFTVNFLEMETLVNLHQKICLCSCRGCSFYLRLLFGDTKKTKGETVKVTFEYFHASVMKDWHHICQLCFHASCYDYISTNGISGLPHTDGPLRVGR